MSDWIQKVHLSSLAEVTVLKIQMRVLARQVVLGLAVERCSC